MCTSRKHSGSAPRSTKAELPTQPRSSSLKTATAPLPDALDRLDRRDDSQRTVELAAEGHGVEVRAGPDARLGRSADQVSGSVHLDLEPGLPHPACGQLVRAILACGAGDAVGADAAADGIELVQALVHTHGGVIRARTG